MKKLFAVTALICLLLNGIIVKTWLVQEASAKEKMEKGKSIPEQLALIKK